MRAFVNYLTAYLRNTSRPALFLTILLVAALVAGNYTFGIEARIRAWPWYFAIGGFFGFYLIVLALVWGLQMLGEKKSIQSNFFPPSPLDLSAVADGPNSVRSEWNKTPIRQPKLLLLLLLAPLYFALKMIPWHLLPLLPAAIKDPWPHYIQLVLQLPLKLGLLFGFCWALYKAGLLPGDNLGAAVGLTRKNFNALPYFGLLLCTLPLIALASTQHDFLLVYPKVKNLAFIDGYAQPAWPWKLLYELSYGLDFLGIELFFRGLLVVVLVNYVGADASASSGLLGTSPNLLHHGPSRSAPSSLGARPPRPEPSMDSVLPMAAFYCTIHFGKPLGECISSFFGGLILGVLAARTRTILGGLIVHLGLAWFMELGGWLGLLLHFK